MNCDKCRGKCTMTIGPRGLRLWRCLTCEEHQARDRIRDAAIERAAKWREEPELHADDSEGGTI